ncbi:MAG: LysR family transcriptional regulator [Pseudomonadales bacterium]
MNWDDTRLFLALARSGSARATAAEQGVSHSTVTRRVDQLESDLGVLYCICICRTISNY